MSRLSAREWQEIGVRQQQQKPKPPTEAELKQKEEARLRQRERIKKQIVERDETLARVELLGRQIEQIEGEIDTLTEQHQAACAPLRQQLEEINQRTLAGAEEFTDIQRQGELRDELHTMTVDLREAVERKKAQAGELFTERHGLAMKYAEGVNLECDLRELASPQTLIELQVARSTSKWARARLEAAQIALQSGKPSPFKTAELAAAQKAVDEAEQAMSGLMTRARDE